MSELPVPYGRRPINQRIDFALGLIRQAHLETCAVRDLLLAEGQSDPRITQAIDSALLLSHAEIKLEDINREEN